MHDACRGIMRSVIHRNHLFRANPDEQIVHQMAERDFVAFQAVGNDLRVHGSLRHYFHDTAFQRESSDVAAGPPLGALGQRL